mmetsp:Transcript_6497/g.13310  ORF Transcript_6497/g.13310 Transcript_6497/m.13310 type:complete len:286 (+) Transcript_6497:37-894(+)
MRPSYPTYGSPMPMQLGMAAGAGAAPAFAGPVGQVAGYQGPAAAPGMVMAPVMQGPNYMPAMQPGAVMMTERSGAQSFAPMPQYAPGMQSASYTPQMSPAGAQGIVHAPIRVQAQVQPFPPGARVRLKGVADNSPYVGQVFVVTNDPPDGSGQVRVQLENAGPGMAMLLGPHMLESANVAPAPQPGPAPPPAAWLEGGAAESPNGLRVGDQVALRGQAANRQYDGKPMIVEAADVGDGTGRVRVVVQHETHVSRLALDPMHLELVPGMVPGAGQVVYDATMPGTV